MGGMFVAKFVMLTVIASIVTVLVLRFLGL
jgi:hypothetical protein